MFKFKFQKALEYKEKLEKDALIILEKVRQKKREETKKLEIIIEKIKLALIEGLELKKGDLDLEKIQNFENYEKLLHKKRDEQIELIKKIDIELEKLQEDFMEKRKERRTFEKLKEKHKKRYLEKINKEEQKLLDESSNIRYNYGSR